MADNLTSILREQGFAAPLKEEPLPTPTPFDPSSTDNPYEQGFKSDPAAWEEEGQERFDVAPAEPSLDTGSSLKDILVEQGFLEDDGLYTQPDIVEIPARHKEEGPSFPEAGGETEILYGRPLAFQQPEYVEPEEPEERDAYSSNPTRDRLVEFSKMDVDADTRLQYYQKYIESIVGESEGLIGSRPADIRFDQEREQRIKETALAAAGAPVVSPEGEVVREGVKMPEPEPFVWGQTPLTPNLAEEKREFFKDEMSVMGGDTSGLNSIEYARKILNEELVKSGLPAEEKQMLNRMLEMAYNNPSAFQHALHGKRAKAASLQEEIMEMMTYRLDKVRNDEGIGSTYRIAGGVLNIGGGMLGMMLSSTVAPFVSDEYHMAGERPLTPLANYTKLTQAGNRLVDWRLNRGQESTQDPLFLTISYLGTGELDANDSDFKAAVEVSLRGDQIKGEVLRVPKYQTSDVIKAENQIADEHAELRRRIEGLLLTDPKYPEFSTLPSDPLLHSSHLEKIRGSEKFNQKVDELFSTYSQVGFAKEKIYQEMSSYEKKYADVFAHIFPEETESTKVAEFLQNADEYAFKDNIFAGFSPAALLEMGADNIYENDFEKLLEVIPDKQTRDHYRDLITGKKVYAAAFDFSAEGGHLPQKIAARRAAFNELAMRYVQKQEVKKLQEMAANGDLGPSWRGDSITTGAPALIEQKRKLLHSMAPSLLTLESIANNPEFQGSAESFFRNLGGALGETPYQTALSMTAIGSLMGMDIEDKEFEKLALEKAALDPAWVLADAAAVFALGGALVRKGTLSAASFKDAWQSASAKGPKGVKAFLKELGTEYGVKRATNGEILRRTRRDTHDPANTIYEIIDDVNEEAPRHTQVVGDIVVDPDQTISGWADEYNNVQVKLNEETAKPKASQDSAKVESLNAQATALERLMSTRVAERRGQLDATVQPEGVPGEGIRIETAQPSKASVAEVEAAFNPFDPEGSYRKGKPTSKVAPFEELEQSERLFTITKEAKTRLDDLEDLYQTEEGAKQQIADVTYGQNKLKQVADQYGIKDYANSQDGVQAMVRALEDMGIDDYRVWKQLYTRSNLPKTLGNPLYEFKVYESTVRQADALPPDAARTYGRTWLDDTPSSTQIDISINEAVAKRVGVARNKKYLEGIKSRKKAAATIEEKRTGPVEILAEATKKSAAKVVDEADAYAIADELAMSGEIRPEVYFGLGLPDDVVARFIDVGKSRKQTLSSVKKTKDAFENDYDPGMPGEFAGMEPVADPAAPLLMESDTFVGSRQPPKGKSKERTAETPSKVYGVSQDTIGTRYRRAGLKTVLGDEGLSLWNEFRKGKQKRFAMYAVAESMMRPYAVFNVPGWTRNMIDELALHAIASPSKKKYRVILDKVMDKLSRPSRVLGADDYYKLKEMEGSSIVEADQIRLSFKEVDEFVVTPKDIDNLFERFEEAYESGETITFDRLDISEISHAIHRNSGVPVIDRKTGNVYHLDGFLDLTVEAKDLLHKKLNAIQNRSYELNKRYNTVPPELAPSSVEVFFKEGLVSHVDGKRRVAAQTDKANNRILIDKEEVSRTFLDKAWTKPKVEGVKALPEDAFNTVKEWELFIIEHEKAHFTEANAKFADVAARENHANQIAYDAVLRSRARQSERGSGKVQPENISSRGSDFAKRLTNIGNDLPVWYKGTKFRNAEHAYQTWKSGTFDEAAYKSTAFKPVGKLRADRSTNYQTMVEILEAKLTQHPDLIVGIDKRGGRRYITSSTHNVTPKGKAKITGESQRDLYWETNGQNRFINALEEAYNRVQKSLYEDTNLQRNLAGPRTQKVQLSSYGKKRLAMLHEFYDEVRGALDKNSRIPISALMDDVDSYRAQVAELIRKRDDPNYGFTEAESLQLDALMDRLAVARQFTPEEVSRLVRDSEYTPTVPLGQLDDFQKGVLVLANEWVKPRRQAVVDRVLQITAGEDTARIMFNSPDANTNVVVRRLPDGTIKVVEQYENSAKGQVQAENFVKNAGGSYGLLDLMSVDDIIQYNYNKNARTRRVLDDGTTIIDAAPRPPRKNRVFDPEPTNILKVTNDYLSTYIENERVLAFLEDTMKLIESGRLTPEQAQLHTNRIATNILTGTEGGKQMLREAGGNPGLALKKLLSFTKSEQKALLGRELSVIERFFAKQSFGSVFTAPELQKMYLDYQSTVQRTVVGLEQTLHQLKLQSYLRSKGYILNNSEIARLPEQLQKQYIEVSSVQVNEKLVFPSTMQGGYIHRKVSDYFSRQMALQEAQANMGTVAKWQTATKAGLVMDFINNSILRNLYHTVGVAGMFLGNVALRPKSFLTVWSAMRGMQKGKMPTGRLARIIKAHSTDTSLITEFEGTSQMALLTEFIAELQRYSDERDLIGQINRADSPTSKAAIKSLAKTLGLEGFEKEANAFLEALNTVDESAKHTPFAGQSIQRKMALTFGPMWHLIKKMYTRPDMISKAALQYQLEMAGWKPGQAYKEAVRTFVDYSDTSKFLDFLKFGGPRSNAFLSNLTQDFITFSAAQVGNYSNAILTHPGRTFIFSHLSRSNDVALEHTLKMKRSIAELRSLTGDPTMQFLPFYMEPERATGMEQGRARPFIGGGPATYSMSVLSGVTAGPVPTDPSVVFRQLPQNIDDITPADLANALNAYFTHQMGGVGNQMLEEATIRSSVREGDIAARKALAGEGQLEGEEGEISAIAREGELPTTAPEKMFYAVVSRMVPRVFRSLAAVVGGKKRPSQILGGLLGVTVNPLDYETIPKQRLWPQKKYESLNKQYKILKNKQKLGGDADIKYFQKLHEELFKYKSMLKQNIHRLTADQQRMFMYIELDLLGQYMDGQITEKEFDAFRNNAWLKGQ